MKTHTKVSCSITLIVLSWCLASPPAWAGSGNGHIALIEVTQNDPRYGTGFAFLYLDANSGYVSPPACSIVAASGRRFVLPTNTSTGRALLGAAMTAKAAGLGVFINGTGSCDDGPHDSESVNFIGMY